jgi:phage shock protein PspC (stress-responsive transcriptional regulator)
MRTPYPPQHPRRLERSRSNRFLGGVCGGLASYLNMDPTLVRILTVLISLFTGVPVILYLVALFVIPEEGTQPGYPPVAPPQYGQSPYDGYGSPATPYPSPAPQAAPQTAPEPTADPVWGGSGAPWEQPTEPEPREDKPQD